MKKQTAVEWLEDNMYSLKIPAIYFVDLIDLVNQAKAMEKEQIIDAFCEGYDHDGDNYDGAEISYYNRTYKGGEQ
jgi:hypothetical protein